MVDVGSRSGFAPGGGATQLACPKPKEPASFSFENKGTAIRSGKWQRMPTNTFVTSLGEVKDAIRSGMIGRNWAELRQNSISIPGAGCSGKSVPLLRINLSRLAAANHMQNRKLGMTAKRERGKSSGKSLSPFTRPALVSASALAACMNFEVIPCPARAFGTLACRSVSV